MFLRLLEVTFLILAIVTLWTQVIWPLWAGKALFPLFGPRAKAEAKLAKARERAEVNDIMDELTAARHRKHHEEEGK